MKAICVFSGGLDSMLAANLIRAQGLDVLALFFETPFFTHQKAEKSAQSLGLPFKVADITTRHLEVVKNPRHGYGGNMNPCIDCHALMVRIAGEMLEQEGAEFILTGEVLGQRPMSQNRNSLALVAAESGFGDLLLRPLSAKHLSPTIPEQRGWVNRELLMGFQGRSRKPQMALAEEMGITEFPTPAGGCLLTDKAFARRLKDLLDRQDNPEVRELHILKLGRHMRVAPGAKLVVGRNKNENNTIHSLAGHNDLVLTNVNTPGPTVLGIGEFEEDALDTAIAVTAAYGDVEEGKMSDIRVLKNGVEKIMQTKAPKKEAFKDYLI